MRNRVVSLAVVALVAVTGALAVVLPASAASGCAAELLVYARYSSMLRGELRVHSFGRPLAEWTLRFPLRYPTEQIKNVEGVLWEQHGAQVTIRNLPGVTLPADKTVSFPYAMTHGVVWTSQPQEFTLNGVTCTTSVPAPPPPSSPPPTSPSPRPSGSPSPTPDPNRPSVRIIKPEEGDHFFAPATITVEAAATAAPGRRITRVEFFGWGSWSDRISLGTDTTAPYTARWRDLPAGLYTVNAQVYDDQGATLSSERSVSVRVLTPGEERQAPYVSVVRDQLWGISPVIDTAAPRRLTPLARTGAEARCVQGRGIWDGPVDATAVAGLAARGVQAVYIPLNEACWLGLSYVDPRYGGEPYRQEIVAYTQRLTTAGITPIVALAWSHGRYTGPGATCRDERAVCAKPMPDAAYAIEFWQSVGQAIFDETVVFDLFTAPYPDRAIADPALAWTCWRSGDQACAALGYPTVGMQQLLAALRSGSRSVALASGLNGGNDLSQWAAYVPDDWFYNVAAAWRPTTPGGCHPPTLPQAPVVVTAVCR
ncbi:Ig-like domain-containing protein [Micromonospora sp. NPDC049107]|uniref:Ig-like domain-containing protein n=1 Tax=unclassified Micromonospora TaxID=2617518 RepID=UPI0033FEEC55